MLRTTLHVAGLLGYCFCGYAIFLVAWTVWKKQRPKHAERWMKFLASVGRRGRKINSGMARWSYIWFVAIWCGAMAYAITRLPKYNVVTEHNVAILQKLDNGDFAYKSDEKPDGDTYRVCAIDKQEGIDVDGMLTQAAKGKYIADKATWEERGTCRSLLKPEWQFWFRDENNNFTYRRVN